MANHNRKFTREEICNILDDVIDNFIASKYAHYTSMLHSRGLYRQMLNYYINTEPYDPIIERMDTLRSLQEQKLLEGVLSKNSDIKDIGAIFVLKTSFGYIERDKKEQNEIARMKIEQDKKVTDTLIDNININFVEDDDEC